MKNYVSELEGGKYKDICFNNVIGEGKQTCFGGKTGTSDDAKDVLFVGFSKNFLIGIRVGYDVPRPLGNSATGGGYAMPIFQEIVTNGLQYLPQIEPIITPQMVPSSLERRVVYGKLACTSPSAGGSATTIYTEYGSTGSSCYSSSAQTYDNNQYLGEASNSQTTPPVNSFNFVLSPNCQCVPTANGNYTLNISYDNKYYPAYTNYGFRSDCETEKFTLRSTTGRPICQSY